MTIIITRCLFIAICSRTIFVLLISFAGYQCDCSWLNTSSYLSTAYTQQLSSLSYTFATPSLLSPFYLFLDLFPFFLGFLSRLLLYLLYVTTNQFFISVSVTFLPLPILLPPLCVSSPIHFTFQSSFIHFSSYVFSFYSYVFL